MHPKHLCYTVAMTLGMVIYTGTVVLSAPVTPLPQMSQHDRKSAKQAPCAEVTGRPGADIAGIQHSSECLDGKHVPAVDQLQPYTVALDGTQAWLGLPCSSILECGITALEPIGQGSMAQVPVFPHSLLMDDTDRPETVLTAGRGEALGKASRVDFTKLITEREAFVQMDGSLDDHTATGSSRQIVWDRLLNLGPLVLLLLEKLLGRL